uniref:Uncharacterized protein n=1 Tax=Zea mays TaxID=4577 RepID=B6UAX0_MAIZE|nr:hypothetical protein [Zea mays]
MLTPIATTICSLVSSASSSTLILPPPPVLGYSRRLRRAFRSPHSLCPPHHPRLLSAPRSTPALAQRPSPHPSLSSTTSPLAPSLPASAPALSVMGEGKVKEEEEPSG